MTVTHLCDAEISENDSKERLNQAIFEALMEAKGIKSIAELSRRTREHGQYVSKATIFRVISGERQSTLRVARSLARELDTTVETLYAKKSGRP